MSDSPGLAARVLLAGVHAYRVVLSPILPPSCRFEPTCSRYAQTALRTHGALRGSWLTLRRIVRCRPGPGGGSGYDPVPPPPADGTRVT